MPSLDLQLFREYILKFLHPLPLISSVALVAMAVILILISRKTVLNTRLLAIGSLCVAMSFILSYVRVLRMAEAGSVTIASMLPLFVFAHIAGPRAGIMAGLCLGLLQALQDLFVVHWTQFLLDYPIAFALLGLAGLFGKNLFLGAAIGGLGRFVCHFLSGVVFFGEYAGNQNVFVYSFIYNMTYMLPEILICLGILLIPGVRSAINHLRHNYSAIYAKA